MGRGPVELGYFSVATSRWASRGSRNECEKRSRSNDALRCEITSTRDLSKILKVDGLLCFECSNAYLKDFIERSDTSMRFFLM